MKILAITSGKGGVGKTTLSLNIARQISAAGMRTLIVDFDIHNKGTTCLFMEKVAQSTTQSITGVMAKCPSCNSDLGVRFAEDINLVDLGYDGSLLLLPSALPEEMVKWESFVCNNESLVAFFRNFLEAVAAKHSIDVILIDCYGGVDTLTIAAAGISDDLIIVNEPDVITFAGTLLLYKQLANIYSWSAKPPRVHFVINRISGRHAFRFLQEEYQKNLAPLAVDRSVLAYLPFDKLVFDTFGHYPFFSELLPKGLYARKVRELIARLWPVAPFLDLTVKSARKRERVYRATAENPFTDPERIFNAWKNCAWALFPIAAMLLLYKSPAASISFFALRSAFYVCFIFCSALILLGVLFEPWQVSRWLVRKARYEGRRRQLVEGFSISNRVRAGLDFIASWTPGSLGVLCFVIIIFVSYGRQLLYPFRNVSIWHTEITGFVPRGNYQKLIMAPKSAIRPGTDLSGSNLDDSNLASVFLPAVNLRAAHIRNATLNEAKFVGDDLSGADFSQSVLTSADLSGSSAHKTNFTGAYMLDAHLWGSDLSEVSLNDSLLYLADFRQSDLRGADFSQAIIKNTEFDGADIRGADFRSANFDYIDSARRVELFAQLEHQGAVLSDEQIAAAHKWMHKRGFDQSKKDISEDTPWWLYWKPGEPAHLNDMVEPRIETLKNILVLMSNRSDDSHNLSSQMLTDLLISAKDFATMSDLLELLLVRGSETDLRVAGQVLAERIKKPFSSENGLRDQGVTLMLTALYSIITKSPTEQADVGAWRSWLSKTQDGRLVGWSWNMWDVCFPAQRFSRQQIAKIRAIRLSAIGLMNSNQLTRWFVLEPAPATRILKASN